MQNEEAFVVINLEGADDVELAPSTPAVAAAGRPSARVGALPRHRFARSPLYWAAALWLWCGFAVGQALLPALREEIISVPKPGAPPVALQATMFRPPGDGPYPLVIINHGKAPGNPHEQPRARYLPAARELVARGYAVVVPMRQGFGGSSGAYVGGGCDVRGNGLAQAEDVRATLAFFARRADIDAHHVVVFGQSHGGLVTLAAGSLGLPGVAGLVNFAGGLRLERCPGWQAELAAAFASYGGRTRVPALFFYGDNDSYWSADIWHEMVRRYESGGGPVRLVAFGDFGDDAHALFGSAAGVPVWLPEVGRFFHALGLPFDKLHDIGWEVHETAPPAPTGFAPLADADALPFIGPAGRSAYAAFLAADPPKAFALSAGGAWAWRGGVSAAMAQALERCAARTWAGACKLYAVDNRVVWAPE